MKAELRRTLEKAVTDKWGNGARIAQITDLAGDASSRSYARLSLSRTGSNVPRSTVVMILAGSGLALSSDELAVFDAPPTELPYLNLHKFLEPIGVRVSEVYVDGVQDGFLLLEDVGDSALRDAVNECSPVEVEAWYRRAIDQLLLIQIAGTRARNDACIAFKQRFDKRLFLWEFDHFVEWGLNRGGADSLPPDQAEALRMLFDDVSTRLAGAPAVLNHRDYHSWNLFVQPEAGSAVRVIDFQDSLLAPAAYDLATLLNDRDTPAVVTPNLERALVSYYHDAWNRQADTPRAYADLWDEYNLCLLQKACKVVGRFYYLELEKGKSGYLCYIPPTLATIRRVLARLPDTRGFRTLAEVLAARFPDHC